jgi:hypothetical protein
MSDYKTPHVHEAVAAILGSLSVDKDGKLPSNMSGRAYTTAGNLSNTVKAAFVEHGLLTAATETIFHHEITADKTGRTLVAISVNGSYTIISTVDGSTLTIGGVGDGLATGTSVANNIASTNAFKNALLRTFMVTETSIEDQAKKGVDDGVDRTQPAGKSRLVELQADLKVRSAAVDGSVKGSAYLKTLVESGEFGGASLAQVWADEILLAKLQATFNVVEGK